MITEKSFLIFDEDNIYISYHPTEPIKIFNCKVDMSECEFNISKKLCWREILPVLTDYLEWLALISAHPLLLEKASFKTIP